MGEQGRPLLIRKSTVAGLPASEKIGAMRLVYDGAHRGDVATGSGSADPYLLEFDGTNWIPVGWLWSGDVSLTIATGSVALPTHNAPQGWNLIIDTESAAATDDLDTITGLVTGDIAILRSADSAREPTAKDVAGGTGQMNLAGDFLLSSTADKLMIVAQTDIVWSELSRSDNAA